MLAAPADARVPRGFVGITADDVFAGDDNYRTANLSAMAAIGVQTIRQTFDWSTIERRPGSTTSRITMRTSPRPPRTASGSSRCCSTHPPSTAPPVVAPPAHRERWRPLRASRRPSRAATALGARCGSNTPRCPGTQSPRTRSGTSPILKIYWCNRRPNAARYVAMLRTVGRAIKGVDRSAHILTAGIPPSKLSERRPDRALPGPDVPRGGTSILRLACHQLLCQESGRAAGAAQIDSRLMNRHGDRRGRLWITEFGWGDRGPKHRLIVGAPAQARRITQAFGLIRSSGVRSGSAESSTTAGGTYRRIRRSTGTCGVTTRAS